MRSLAVIVVACLATAGLLVWRDNETTLPGQPDHEAMVRRTQEELQPTLRALVPLAPPVLEMEEPPALPPADLAPVPPAIPEAVLDAATFVAAGLTEEQANELVEGISRLRFQLSAAGAVGPPMRCASILLAMSAKLPERIKDKTIAVAWIPRVKPWPQFAGNSFGRDVGSDVVTYTAHGRRGFLTLSIPRSLCAEDLWAAMVKDEGK